jgi:hypothetical protein
VVGETVGEKEYTFDGGVCPGRRQNPARYVVTVSNAQGQFMMRGVPPGNYKAFAWESVLPGAYENAELGLVLQRRSI